MGAVLERGISVGALSILGILATATLLSLGWFTLGVVILPAIAILLLFGKGRELTLRSTYVDITILLMTVVLLLTSWLLPHTIIGSLAGLLFPYLIFYGLFLDLEQGMTERIFYSVSAGGVLSSILFLISAAVGTSEWITWVFTILGLLSMAIGLFKLRTRREGEIKIERNFLLIFLLLTAFYSLELYLVFPDILRMISNDLLYHQSYARVLVEYPTRYKEWSYLGFHSSLAFSLLFSRADTFSLMSSASVLNFLSFLLIALSFSKMEHRRESLIIWGIFTGFGWLAALKYGVGPKSLELISKYSYKSLIWSQPIFFWGLPLTFGIALLSALIYVDVFVDGRKKVPLTMFLLLYAFFVHVAEALVFVAYLLACALLDDERFHSALGATLASAVLTLLFLAPGVYVGVGTSASIYTLLISAAALALSKFRGPLSQLISGLMNPLSTWKSYIVVAIASLYVSGLVTWLMHLGEVDIDEIYYLGQVPWFFYPVLLGVTGLLALVAVKERYRIEYALLVMVSLLIGRAITYYKLSGGKISYWEYRFPLYMALGLAILAAPILGRLVKASKRSLSASLLLGLVLFSGFASTAMSVNMWSQVTSSGAGTLMKEDFEFAVSTPFFRKNALTALTLTSYSLAVASLLSPPRNNKMLAPWISYWPEVPLYTLSKMSSDKVAVITTIGDIGFLERDNSSFNYLRLFMGPVRKYPSITVVNVSSPPVLEASAIVVLPSDVYLRRRALVAYELIRSKLPTHTIYLSDDPKVRPGLFIGPTQPIVNVREEIPRSPYDLRWFYIWGNFTEGKEGLEVSGNRGVAVTSFELDNGTYQVRACGQMLGYIGLIYDFVNFDNYRFFQVYLDKGFGIYRIVTGGEVKSSRPFKVPVRIGDECVNITLRLENGNMTATVNGKAYPLPPAEKMGVLGLETGNFSGTITGTVDGVHSLRWSPPPNSKLVSVLGPAELDLTEWVDKGLRNLSSTKASFSPPELHLGYPGGEMPEVKAVLTGFNATGSIEVVGRPIWYEVNGTRVYLNESRITLTAKEMSFRNGEGFYMDLDLKGASIKDIGLKAERMTIRFRLPVSIEARGNVTLIRYHQFQSYVRRTKTIHTTRANFTVVMADNAQLLSHLDVPKEDISPTKLLYKAFDETKYLPEAFMVAVITFIALYYLERRYGWEPTRIKAKRKGRSRRKPRGS